MVGYQEARRDGTYAAQNDRFFGCHKKTAQNLWATAILWRSQKGAPGGKETTGHCFCDGMTQCQPRKRSLHPICRVAWF